MSAELRMSLVYELTNPEEFSNEVNQVKMRSSEPTYAECLALITFTDDYLQPGLIKHNRPLFISGYLNGLGITRIMIDGGSAVNLLPLRMRKHQTMFYLGGLGCMIIVSSLLLITNVLSKPKVVSRRG